MFNQLVISGQQEGTHKRWTVATSFGVQLIIVGVMILIPLDLYRGIAQGHAEYVPRGTGSSASSASARCSCEDRAAAHRSASDHGRSHGDPQES